MFFCNKLDRFFFLAACVLIFFKTVDIICVDTVKNVGAGAGKTLPAQAKKLKRVRSVNMRIGFGKVNITPPEGLELSGYGYFIKRRNTGVVEELFARAAVIEQDGAKAVLLNADLIGLHREISERLEETIERKYGIPYERIMIASIHTHTGPMTGELCGCGEFDREYYQELSEKLVLAVDHAFADLAQVEKITEKSGTMKNSFAHNRSVKGGEIDDAVRTVYIERRDARPIALVNYSCHPVSYRAADKVSSDYCGIFCRLMEEQGVDAIYLNGFCGNINPWERDTDPVNCAPHAAQQLFDLVQPMLGAGEELPMGEMRACGDYLPMALLPITIDEIEAEYDLAAVAGPEFARNAGIWAYTQKLRVALDDAEYDYMQYKALCMGKLLLVYVSGETAIEFGKYLQKRFSDHLVLFVGNAFATTRYIPTEELVTLHGYEGFSSCFAYNAMPVAHHAGEDYFEALADQAEEIAQ